MKKQPLYEEIFNKILSDIHSSKLIAGDRLPSEKELAQAFSVSRITVQRAVNMLAEKNLVDRIIGKGTFVRSEDGSLHGGARLNIGVMLSNISAVHGFELLKNIERRATQLNANVVFKNSYGDKELERRNFADLRAINVDGLIVQPVLNEVFNVEIMQLALRKFPVILIDRNLKDAPISFIGSDNSAIMQELMRKLFDAGHEVISLVSCQSVNVSSLEERRIGFNEAYAAGNKLNPALNLTIKSNNDDFENNYAEKLRQDKESIKAHILKNRRITCFIAAEYFISVLIRRAADELNMRIPRDVSLITFDNVAHYGDTAISYIKQNEERIATLAVEQILRQITSQAENTKIYCEAKFIDCGSIRALR
jgi:DNA-binding LacI/PurR family transcriptional regulator